MKTVYIPAGATYNYETLVTDNVIVHGHLHVMNGLKAKHISGRGFITAGEVSADIVDVTELECGTVICRRLLAQRVSVNEAMISESAAVSRFFSANYVKAPSLTVAVSEIGEADAEEIVHLTPKPRGMLLTLLSSKLRTFWLRLTASRPQGRFEKPRTEAPVEEPSDTPEDTEMKANIAKIVQEVLAQQAAEKAACASNTDDADDFELQRMIGTFKLLRDKGYTAKVQVLGKRYQQNAALLKRFQPGTSCPVCRRVLSQQEYPAFRQALQAETERIAADGTQLKGQIAELQEMEQKSQSTFEQFKADDLVRYQSEIDALNQKREQLQAAAAQQNMQRQQTLEQIRARIQNLSASMECGTLNPADSERLAACKASLEDCRVQLAAAQQVLSAAPEDFDERIHKIEQEITEKKIVMKDVILYMSKRAEMTFSKLALNRVKISLYDVVKTTGELKDVFRFTYNGRRYDRLSLSEKIRAGAEVSELVKRLTGRNYPVFFDNMESVDDLSNIRPTSQMILAKCVRNAELSVRAGGTAMPKAA